jgi:hypothetical protein
MSSPLDARIIRVSIKLKYPASSSFNASIAGVPINLSIQRPPYSTLALLGYRTYKIQVYFHGGIFPDAAGRRHIAAKRLLHQDRTMSILASLS